MSKRIYLTFESSLTDVCEVNASFDRGVLRICYPGKNRNRTYIDKEDLVRCAKTLPYVPLVGNYIRSEEDFGGHDVEVITTLDGTLRMVNKTQPVGVVPSDAKVYFDTVIDKDGNEKEYLFVEVLLWKRQEAYKKIKEDGVVSHSMEITVKSGETIDGIFHIYDFEFTALCLLGSNVEPCFEDSALVVYDSSFFKAQFELMMDDFKESFNLATTSLEDNTYSQDDTKVKGGEEDLEPNKDNVFTEDPKNPEVNETFEEGASAETKPEAAEPDAAEGNEPEATNAEDPETDDPAEGEPEGEALEGVDFALSGAIRDGLWEAIAAQDRITDEYGEWTRYFFVDFDIEKGEVYFEDCVDGWKLYGCNYTMDGDHVVVDFESKKRMKYTIVDFDEGSQAKDMGSIFSAVNESLSAKHQAEIAKYDAELNELREFKANADESAALAERQAVVAEFEDIAGTEEFVAISDHLLDFEVEALREKCYAIRGKNITNPTSATFSAHTSMPRFPVESNGIRFEDDEYADAPYGGVVEHYLGKA